MMGGLEFSYSKRKNYLRCEFVCGGMTGLHPSKKWSTWSPGRFFIPEDDGAFREAMIKGIKAYDRRPRMEGGFPHILMRSNLYLTCGNCQLLCWPNPADRKENYPDPDLHRRRHSRAGWIPDPGLLGRGGILYSKLGRRKAGPLCLRGAKHPRKNAPFPSGEKERKIPETTKCLRRTSIQTLSNG